MDEIIKPTSALATGRSTYGYSKDYPASTWAGSTYWRLAGRHKIVLAASALVGIATALLVTLPQRPVYQARTSIEIQDMNQDFMNIRNVSPVAESGGAGARTDIPTQVKVLQSDSVLRRALDRLPAGDRPSLEMARNNTRIRAPGMQTRILDVVVDWTNPRTAAAFANAVVEEYIEQNIRSRWEMTQRTGDWLAKQLGGMRARLEQSEDKLQRYAKQAGLLFTAERNSVAEERLREIQAELSKARAERIATQSRFETAQGATPDASADVIRDESLRNYNNTLADLRRQRAQLSTVYTPEHNKVRQVEAQISAIEAAWARQRAAILMRIRNDYQEAGRRESLLEADYSRQIELVMRQDASGIQYSILKREVDTNRQLYEAMLQRVKEASVASALKASNIRVIDPAVPPAAPYKPRLALNVALGLMAGLAGGVAFIVRRERGDNTLREPGEIEQYLTLPELGVIPSLPALARERVGTRPDSTRTGLLAWDERAPGFAESFHSLVASVLYGSPGLFPKVLAVTSARSGEGKTTVASYLAIALAEFGHSVLLVDADLRRPRIHDVFGTTGEPGLSTLLREGLGAGTGQGVRASGIPGLQLVTAGGATPAASSLLYSGRFEDIVRQARAAFDFVVIDTPPLLFACDARIVGRVADAIVVVARSGQTGRMSAQTACRRLAKDRAPVLGVVLNDWDVRSGPEGYYHDYQSYYGRRRGKPAAASR